jgi:murein DD-endopeptidase MepM/ murein hydrolase activator NlpD
MRPPFSLVFVHGDGSSVLRLNVPRWLGYGLLVIPAAVAGVALALAGAQALIAYQRTELAGLHRRVEDQTQVIESFRATASTVRNELAAWKSMHANMWEALGPELGAGSRSAAGVGGTRVVEDEEKLAAGPRDELALLLESVTEEGPRIRELERLIGRTGEVVSSLPLRWPVRGRVNSEYGKRPSPWGGAAEHHSGLDISTPPGTPVACPAPGKVVLAGGGGDYGRHVVVQHANGVRSLYGHLSKVEVRAGQSVEKGQLLGLTGSTGRSTGPHLHYELRVAGKSVNPRKFLWEGKDVGPLPEATASR